VAALRPFHKVQFPNESDEYRRARLKLLRSEIELRRNIEAVAAQRRKLPPGGQVSLDYVFEASAPPYTKTTTVRLSELFAPGKNTLYLYNFMFPEAVGSMTPCPSCTSIIDAVDGAARHVVQRINFAVIAKAPVKRFQQHARRRGWNHVMLLSSSGNTFNRDYHAEDPDGQQWPLAHVFAKKSRKISHSWSSELWFARADRGQDRRHVDFMWPMWSIFDATPDGRGTDWGPEITYP
jgi:predicted dithiol-disulfide oxidoreductase (DUF899 family)